MPRKAKTAAANLPVPQSRDEAAASLARIGVLSRDAGRIEADMNDRIATLKERAEAAAGPLRDEARALLEGLRTWCEAHRVDLTQGGRVKTADLGTGTVAWRMRPPKVSLRDVDAVVERIKHLGLSRFLRVKEEPNKEAMLAEPPLARTIAGVTITSAGEDFIAEPFEAELEAKP